jgi:hypothetical protein
LARIVTLRPNDTRKFQDWAAVGAASGHTAVSDASDSSYIESTANGATARFDLTTYTLQPGEFVSGIRVRGRAEANRPIAVGLRTPRLSPVGGFPPCTIRQDRSVREFTTYMFPGSGDPFSSDKGVMTQAMLDGLKLELVLSTSAAGASRVYEVRVDLHISERSPSIVRRGDRLHLSTGPAARLVGFNYYNQLKTYEAPLTHVNRELTNHAEKGFNLVRLFAIPNRIKAGRGTGAWTGPALGRLVEILQHCNDIGVYVDLTHFATFEPAEDPAWYAGMTEAQRWAERRNLVRQVAGMFDQHPSVAFHCVGNEFHAPATLQPKWIPRIDPGPAFQEVVVKDPVGRTQETIWSDWLADVLDGSDGAKSGTTDPHPLFGCGSFPPIDTEVRCTPRRTLSSGLDLVLVHAYPERDPAHQMSVTSLMSQINEARGLGLPVVIEELFPSLGVGVNGSCAALDELYAASFNAVSGIVGHSDGRTSTEYPDSGLTDYERVFQRAMRWFEERSGAFRRAATPTQWTRISGGGTIQ